MPHILLSLTPWKPRLSRLLESPVINLSVWANHVEARPEGACLNSLRQTGGGERTRPLPRQRDRSPFTPGETTTVLCAFSSSVLAGTPAELAPWHCLRGSSARETLPLLHPSRGDRVHTVLVGCGCRLMVMALYRACWVLCGGSVEFDVAWSLM